MDTSLDFQSVVEAASGRSDLSPLLEALGMEPLTEPIPESAWPAFGLRAKDGVGALAVAGRSGSLDALLIETRDDADGERVAQLVRAVRARNPARLHLFIVASPGYRRLVLGLFGLDDRLQLLTLERDRVRASDVETLEEMAPRKDEAGLELAIRYSRALDRSRTTRRFFRDFRARRNAVAEAWTGVPKDAARERAQLALLFLSRLTFLYFLQRRGALAGDDRYLPSLYARWRATRDGRSFYRARIVPLFFAALNRRPEEREPEARALGDLPYLNGGLFERHALERRFPELDLPDSEVAACLEDLLERYRFTARETTDGAGDGIDPEILGRVFEGLMAPGQRGETGSFYTPAPVVRRVVREAVVAYVGGACTAAEAAAVVDGKGAGLPPATRHRVRSSLERVRILDPACGSGAFLLGALHRLAITLGTVSDEASGAIRRRIVGNALHGVDLLDDAALLCSLRLWLALSVDDDRVRPLPNLDRRIRQGDALVDPLDLTYVEGGDGDGAPSWRPRADPQVRRALRAVEPAARRYLDSRPSERAELRARLDRAERRLATRWARGAYQSEQVRLRRLKARASDRDLFGDVPESARRAGADARRAEDRLRQLEQITRRLEEEGELPFFSFGVHFAHAAEGFDLIVSNPPWVRSHRWPDRLRRLCARFEVCRDPAWSRAAELTGAPVAGGAQVDLSLLFIERSIRLLAPGGIIALIVPAKALRALYGGAARRMLLRELDLIVVEDHALDQGSIFRADAFAAVLIGKKRSRDETTASSPVPEPPPPGEVRVRSVRRGVPPLEYCLGQDDLPLFPEDPASPWLLAPPDVLAVCRDMQRAGPALGAHPGLRVRRGVMTGANDVLLFTSVEPKISGLAVVQAAGHDRARRRGESKGRTRGFRALVEGAALRPIVRGADVDAFRFSSSVRVAWCHDDKGRPTEPPPRMAGYLQRHRERLERRSGWRCGLPLGSIFRLSPETLGPKVAWHDLSDTLRAVALPATIQQEGTDRALIPLNTVYFLPTEDGDSAMLLAGLFNSLPIRSFARSLAERAKDARFRFFAWTISCLPLPPNWNAAPAAEEVRRIARRGHRDRGLNAADAADLDRAVARLYALEPDQLETLRRFDRWLRGEP